MIQSATPLAAVGDVAILDVRNLGSAVLHLKGGAVNATGVTVVIEGSVDSENGVDGTFFALQGAAAGSNTATSSPLSAASLAAGVGASNAHRLNVASYTFVRARLTARTAGDIVATWVATPLVGEPLPVNPVTSVTATPPTGNAVLRVSDASTNFVLISNSAGSLFEVTISNPTATPVYVKLYNKATAPTAADVPIATILAPAGSFQSHHFGTSGKRFTAGIGLGITGGAAANDATVAAAGVVVSGTRS